MNITNDKVTDYLDSLYHPLTEELALLREKSEAEFVPVILKDTERFLVTMLKIIKPKRILEIGTAVGYSASCFAEICGGDTEIVTLEASENMYEAAVENIRKMGYSDRIKVIFGDACESMKKVAWKEERSTQGSELHDDKLHDDKLHDDKLHDDKLHDDELHDDKLHDDELHDDKLHDDELHDDKLHDDEMHGDEFFDLIFIDASKSHYREFFDEAIKLCRSGSVIICDNVLMRAQTVSDEYDRLKKHKTMIRRMREFMQYIISLETIETSVNSLGDGIAICVVK